MFCILQFFAHKCSIVERTKMNCSIYQMIESQFKILVEHTIFYNLTYKEKGEGREMRQKLIFYICSKEQVFILKKC